MHLTRAARVSAGAVGQLVGVRRSTPAARLVDLSVAEPTRQALIRLVGWTRNRSKVSQQHRFLTASGSPHGVAALFTGPPGTGKTFAAHAIAAELGVELLTVDLSAVVDKYIGETQKNLEKVFHAAEILGAVLFFDEADALFGSRSQVNDARDKYANQETAWLLQRMEAFDGLAVLATNLRANLDRAFTRRLSFVIIFDPPDPALRKQLWTRYLQDAQPQDRSDPVDIVLLAEHADLTGGEIKNVVLSAVHAALLADAPLGMGHVLTATAQEFDKLGRRLPALLSTTGTGRPEMRDSQ
ncbi:MAG: ATP-binding protein [Nakamurella sp.]